MPKVKFVEPVFVEPRMVAVFYVDVVTPSCIAGSVRVKQTVEMGLYYEDAARALRNAEKRARERLESHHCITMTSELSVVYIKEEAHA